MITKDRIDTELKTLLPHIYAGCELKQNKFYSCWIIFIKGKQFTKPGKKWGIFMRKNRSGKYYLTDGGLISKYILDGYDPAYYMPTANEALHKDFHTKHDFTTSGKNINFRVNKIISIASGVASFYGLLTYLAVLAKDLER